MMAIRKKFVFIGDDDCGKTSLLIAFTKGIFQQVYVPTEFRIYDGKIVVQRKKVVLSLCDTSGHADHEKDRILSYTDTDIVLICFSVDSPRSLVNIREKWTPEVQHFCQGVPIMLVATKQDLRNDPEINEDVHERRKETIKSKEGRAMAKDIKAFAYLECSAKTGEGVQKVFETATHVTLQNRSKKYYGKCILL